MPQSSKLLAWVEPRGSQAFLAAFVGGAAVARQPAEQLCASHDEARQWIEGQAGELGLPVEWLNEAPAVSARLAGRRAFG
jgi:hypothetical protein